MTRLNPGPRKGRRKDWVPKWYREEQKKRKAAGLSYDSSVLRKNPKRKATPRKRVMRPNPAAPKFPINRMVKVRGVRVNPKGVVTAVIIEDKHMDQLKQGKRRSSNPIKVYKKRYGGYTLQIMADFTQASSPVKYRTDNSDSWDHSPFQVSNFSHSPAKALAGVNEWLKGQ